jgi:sigma-B regulation protein RsbU (phosphoserine phosphatase)
VFDLRSFGLTDVLECSAALRHLGAGASSMEQAAGAVVDYLYGHLIDKETGGPALALVRLYKTHRFDELEPDLRAFVEAGSGGGPIAPDTRCVTLLATAGDEPAWNDRRRSKRHQAIPLDHPAVAATVPEVHRLIHELGADSAGQSCGLLHVADAAGSSDGCNQRSFVEPHGIRSVIAYGGALPSGYIYAVVMFAKVPVSAETAAALAPLRFATLLALLPFVERRLFDSDPEDTAVDLDRDLRITQAQAAALGHLLETRHQVVNDQAKRLAASEATKAAILNAALDAIITMDIDGRIVDFNPAAEAIFGYRREEATGRILADLIVPPKLRAVHNAGLERYRRTGEGPILDRRIEITAIRSDGQEFPIELTVGAVHTAEASLFSGHIRDITERVQAQEALRAAGRRYADIARRLQASLLPPELPAVPGIDLGCNYEAGAEGLDVGGDFYDLFEVGDGRWGVVLGDVMGKGADAAAITALARHTVRAAAIRAADPAAVLHLLNDALLRHGTERFATVVFAFLDLRSGWELAVSSGGHPLPLLRGSAGVVPVGTAGRLLGPFPDWDGDTTRVALNPGDLVLFYSDGVTEARRDGDEFGAERLSAALAATGTADAAQTVQAVATAVDRFATTPADDVAMLALRVAPVPPAG